MDRTAIRLELLKLVVTIAETEESNLKLTPEELTRAAEKLEQWVLDVHGKPGADQSI